jgi:anti-anti-sigma factor
MQDDQILYANLQGVCFFRFVGEIRHGQSAGLEALINSLFNDKNGVCKDVVVDLSQASYLDSTNLGLLAMIARNMLEKHQRKPTLISTDKDMTTLLQSMCLDQVFTLLDKPLDAPDAFVEVSDQGAGEQQRAKMILAAHEELLKLGESNRKTFQPVVDLLKQELQSGEEQQ